MLDQIADAIGLSTSDFLALLGIVVAILLALIKPVRAFFSACFHHFLNLLGITRWTYRKEFIKVHGTLRNIYLDREEQLDLRATYIPLHINRPNQTGRMPAIEYLSDPRMKRIMVVGDPGTGKTTLIKAFGSGLLRHLTRLRINELHLIKQLKEVPVIVDLRHFASPKYADLSLHQYILEYTFKKQLGIKNGPVFLRRILNKRQCLVLLDGLDEIGENDYESAKTRVAEFCTGDAEEFRTSQARVIMTCRVQNFERIRRDWVPVIFPESVVLAPFNTDEVYAFIQRRKDSFTDGRTPIKFYEQIQASGLADFHRNPLVLTISLGLYINIPKYQIPRSLAKFYDETVGELLRRHDFRTTPYVDKLNQYNSDDKYRFLRELALEMALRDHAFDEFTFKEITDYFNTSHARIANIEEEDANPFIREIIYHSGIISRVSEDDTYIFAHRSIHEYFIATQLARSPKEGSKILLGKANDSLWRQVIVFFSSIDHAEVESFLSELVSYNLELAGHCVPAAQIVSVDLAEFVADGLVQEIMSGNVDLALPALVSITHSQHSRIKELALDKLQYVLEGILDADLNQLVTMKDEDISALLKKLAFSGTLEVIPACIRLGKLISDRTEIVTPFWHCLSLFEVNERKDLSQPLIRELLEAAMSEDGLKLLQRQPAHKTKLITRQQIKEAYPFEKSYPLDSNLVILLSWAEQENIIPQDMNLFFTFKINDKEAFKNVERDRNKRVVKVNLNVLGWLVHIAFIVGLLVSFIDRIMKEGGLILNYPEKEIYWLILQCVIAFIAGFSMLFYLNHKKLISDDNDTPALHMYMIYIFDKILNGKVSGNWVYGLSLVFLFYSIYTVLFIPFFLDASFLVFLLAAPFLSGAFFNIFVLKIFKEGNIHYLRKPNPAIGIYDDERSKHWVTISN